MSYASPEEMGMTTPERDVALLRSLGEAYSERHSAELEAFCEGDSPTLEQLSEIFWRSGVLDRLVPARHEERVARRTLGRDVFDGDAHDPELFWRILYACAQIETVDSSGVGERSTWLSRPIEFTVQKLLNTDPELFERLFGVGTEHKNPDTLFIQTARERAIQALIAAGERPSATPLPIGTPLVYKGISAQVHGYTADGLVVLQAASLEDYVRIVEANPRKSCAVVASELQ